MWSGEGRLSLRRQKSYQLKLEAYFMTGQFKFGYRLLKYPHDKHH